MRSKVSSYPFSGPPCRYFGLVFDIRIDRGAAGLRFAAATLLDCVALGVDLVVLAERLLIFLLIMLLDGIGGQQALRDQPSHFFKLFGVFVTMASAPLVDVRVMFIWCRQSFGGRVFESFISSNEPMGLANTIYIWGHREVGSITSAKSC